MHTQHVILRIATLLLVVPLAACSSNSPKSPVASTAAQAPYTVGLSFDPTPPKVGTEQFTVTVSDNTGAPVTGAKVQILPSYESVPGGHLIPKTGMGGVSAPLDAKDVGDGTYTASMDVPKAVYWTFTADATIGDTIVSVQRGVQVAAQ